GRSQAWGVLAHPRLQEARGTHGEGHQVVMKIPASIAGAAAAAIMALAMGPVAIGASSFSDSDNKFTDAQESLSALLAENALLKQQLSEAQAAVKSLTDSLTVANGDAEAYRKEAAGLKLQMEALGVDGLSGDRGK